MIQSSVRNAACVFWHLFFKGGVTVRKRSCLGLVGLLLGLLLLAGCGGEPPKGAAPVELNVSAAVSMKDALEEIQQQYQKKNPKVKLVFNLGASGSLQKQIEQGAPADLFISAAPKQMDELQGKGLLQQQTRKNLLENQLVLIVPQNSPLAIKSFEELADAAVKRLAVGEPQVVPAGQYAQQVLKKLNLWEKLGERMVLAKDVRTVLTYVESGNADAGIVYKTDAAVSTKIKIIATAASGSHQPIIYPAAILANAKQPKEAEAFLQYLLSPDAAKVFEKYGFAMGK